MAETKSSEFTVLATETYRDHSLEVRLYPAESTQWSSRDEYIGVAIDGRRCGPVHKDAGAASKWFRKAVDAWAHDDEIYPTLVRILNACGQFAEETHGLGPNMDEAPAVGSVVWIYSRGMMRAGLVEHVTRTGRVTAAYVTRGGIDEAVRYRGPDAHATITRKVAPFAELVLIAHDAEEVGR